MMRRATPMAVGLFMLGALAVVGATPVAAKVVVCMGKDALEVPFEGAAREYARGATLRLVAAGADSLAIEKKAGDQWTNLTTLYGLKAGYELPIAQVIAGAKAGEEFRLVVTAGDTTKTQAFKVSDAEVAPCEPVKSAAEAPGAKEIQALLELVTGPSAADLAQYAENAVVEVNARTGKVTPAERVKLRRGHYLIIKITDGLLYDCSVQALAEGGSLTLMPCGSTVATNQVERRSARDYGIVPFARPLAQEGWVKSRGSDDDRAVAVQQAMAGALQKDRTISFTQNLTVLAAYRETVVSLSLIPAPTTASLGDTAALPSRKDVTLTMNAQKWGGGLGAGFVLAVPGVTNYKYVDTDDAAKKRIAESSSSAAQPIPFVFLNLWPWERSQWAGTIGVGLEPESQQAAFALGASYLFSGHGQVTLGVVLSPEEVLPSGYRNGTEVQAGDTVLQSLDSEYKAKVFIGIGWRAGSDKDPTRAGETEPTGK